MKIQVLGSGCPICKKLYELTQKAVAELGLKEQVEYVTGTEGIQTIIQMGAMNSLVLAINGKPIMTGSVSGIQGIKDIILKEV